MFETLYFSLFAIIAVICAVSMLLAKHPLNAAMALVGVMLCLGGTYAILSAPFLGVIQLLTYAGAIMMLVVFVIMVLNSAHDHVVPRFDRKSGVLILIPLLLCAGQLLLLRTQVFTAHPAATRGTTKAISAYLFNTSEQGPGYWVLFLAIGLLLLSAMAAAVLLSKKRLDKVEAP